MNAPVARTVVHVDFAPERPQRGDVAPTGRVPRVVQLLALAHKIDGMIRNGELDDLAEAARRLNLTRARIRSRSWNEPPLTLSSINGRLCAVPSGPVNSISANWNVEIPVRRSWRRFMTWTGMALVPPTSKYETRCGGFQVAVALPERKS